jgi:hypothetical protein
MLLHPLVALATLREHVHMEHGFFIGFAREPDGGYAWASVSELALGLGETVGGGTADGWDGATLAAVEDLYLPSTEGESLG